MAWIDESLKDPFKTLCTELCSEKLAMCDACVTFSLHSKPLCHRQLHAILPEDKVLNLQECLFQTGQNKALNELNWIKNVVSWVLERFQTSSIFMYRKLMV